MTVQNNSAVCFIMIIPRILAKVEGEISWPRPEYYN
jgi:hypothetical protein